MTRNASTTSTRSAAARRFGSIVTSLGIVAGLAVFTAAPALAEDAPMYGYTYTAFANVACDASTSQMIVSATATTWQAQGPLGPIPSVYDAGQSMSYDVLAREVGQTEWTSVFTWSPWQFIRTNQGNGDVTINVPTELGTSVVQGTAGHNYEILVQVDYWTGAENVVNVPVTYSQTLSLNSYGTYFLNPGYCHL